MLLSRLAGQHKHVQTGMEVFLGFVIGFSVAYVLFIRTLLVKRVPNTQFGNPRRVQTDAGDSGSRDWFPGNQSFHDNGEFVQLSKNIRSLLEKVGTDVEGRSLNKDVLNRLKGLEHKIEQLTNSTQFLRPAQSDINAEEDKLHTDDYTVANRLYDKVRVLCWVMTQPSNLETRARHIKNTWGKRCHKLLFFTSVANETFPTIGLPNTYEDRSQLNRKTIRAFQYVHDHYWGEYDWFMRTDDDAYVIMENLRYFLSEQDPNGVYYFGHHFRTIVPGGYFSGGPGIVLGREALKRYATASRNSSLCFQGDTFADDAELGKCLYQVGIKPGNSTDRLGRSRFHCFTPGTHVMKYYPDWFYAYDANGAHGGRESMSDYAIGFHYVNDVNINELEYYVYHLRPYGVKFADQDLNWKQTKRNEKA